MVEPIYLCPSSPKQNCQWEGFQEEVVSHFQKTHQDYFLNVNHFILDLNQEFSANYLMHINGETFLIQFKYAEDFAEIRLRFLGTLKRARNLSYHVEIDSGNFAFASKHHSDGYSLITRKDGAVLVDVSGIRTICGKKVLNNVVCYINIEGSESGFTTRTIRRSFHERKVLDNKVREIFQRNSSFRSSIRKRSTDGLEFVESQKKKSFIEGNLSCNQDFVHGIIDEILDDVTNDVTKDFTEDVAKNITKDVTKDVAKDVTTDVIKDVTKDISKNVIKDVTKRSFRDSIKSSLDKDEDFFNFSKPFDNSFFDEDDEVFQEKFLRENFSMFSSESLRISESSEFCMKMELGAIEEHELEYKQEITEDHHLEIQHEHKKEMNNDDEDKKEYNKENNLKQDDKQDENKNHEEEEKAPQEIETTISKETKETFQQEKDSSQEKISSQEDISSQEENSSQDETPSKDLEQEEIEDNPLFHPLILRNKSSKLTPNRLSKAEMEYYEKINLMRCESCHMIMIPPIFVCLNGHSVCVTCKPLNCSCKSGVTDMRNIDLEEISRSLTHPCRFLEKGCTELYSCYEIRFHEIKCDYFLYKCPSCETIGKFVDIQSHIRLFHPSIRIVDSMEHPFPRNSEFLVLNKFGMFYCTSQIYENTIEWCVVFTGREKISFSCMVVIKTKKNTKVYNLKRNGNTCKIIIHLNDLKNNRVKDKNAMLHIKTN